MSKIIKITESDLTRIIKRVIMEQNNCEEEYNNFQCPNGTIRGEYKGINSVEQMAITNAQSNWLKSKGLSSGNFSMTQVVDRIQCKEGSITKCIVCINEPGTKVKPIKLRSRDFK